MAGIAGQLGLSLRVIFYPGFLHVMGEILQESESGSYKASLKAKALKSHGFTSVAYWLDQVTK